MPRIQIKLEPPQSSMKRLTEKILPSFLEDLTSLKSRGYPEPMCDKVKAALKKIEKNCQSMATSTELSQVAVNFGDFLETYDLWNGNKEETNDKAVKDRIDRVKRLKEIRKEMKRNFKNLDGSLTIARDLKTFCDNTVKHLDRFTDEFSGIYFPHLKGNINAYYLRLNPEIINELD